MAQWTRARPSKILHTSPRAALPEDGWILTYGSENEVIPDTLNSMGLYIYTIIMCCFCFFWNGKVGYTAKRKVGYTAKPYFRTRAYIRKIGTITIMQHLRMHLLLFWDPHVATCKNDMIEARQSWTTNSSFHILYLDPEHTRSRRKHVPHFGATCRLIQVI